MIATDLPERGPRANPDAVATLRGWMFGELLEAERRGVPRGRLPWPPDSFPATPADLDASTHARKPSDGA